MNECVVFQTEPHTKMDSHAIYNPETDELTIPVSGKYGVMIGSMVYVKNFKAGDVIKKPNILMSESCGMFFNSLVRGIK